MNERMNERYLYKAKRLDNGEWVGGYYAKGLDMYENEVHLIFDPTTIFYSDGKTDGFEEIDSSTLCQYTELKDENGILICENDIVNFLGHIGLVTYEAGSFGIAFKQYIDWEEIKSNIEPATGCNNSLYACENDNYISFWEILWNFDYLSTVYVIGNIFDNPELLESENE